MDTDVLIDVANARITVREPVRVGELFYKIEGVFGRPELLGLEPPMHRGFTDSVALYTLNRRWEWHGEELITNHTISHELTDRKQK